MYAAQGYTVVASDCLGCAKSTCAYHRYLHADSEASSVIDLVRAARAAAAAVGADLSARSCSLATRRAATRRRRRSARDTAGEINVVAGAHLAGPYNLSGSLKVTTAIAGYQSSVPFFITAGQKVYGDVHANVSTVFRAPYAATIENLLPSATLNTTMLVTSGASPGGTPAQARDALT